MSDTRDDGNQIAQQAATNADAQECRPGGLIAAVDAAAMQLNSLREWLRDIASLPWPPEQAEHLAREIERWDRIRPTDGRVVVGHGVPGVSQDRVTIMVDGEVIAEGEIPRGMANDVLCRHRERCRAEADAARGEMASALRGTPEPVESELPMATHVDTIVINDINCIPEAAGDLAAAGLARVDEHLLRDLEERVAGGHGITRTLLRMGIQLRIELSPVWQQLPHRRGE